MVNIIKQKGAGGSCSKVSIELDLDYSNRSLPTSEISSLLRKYKSSELCNITSLNLNGNMMTELPNISLPNLLHLKCNDNRLRVLPELPHTLTQLSCTNNDLAVLPDLHHVLTQLNCGSNQLTGLPKLPDRITRLSCDHNYLTVLPYLPDSLTELFCQFNELSVLPKLPDDLVTINCNNNPFISPFDTFVDIYNEGRDLNLLKTNIINYYSTPTNFNRSRKMAMLADLEYMPPSNIYPGGQGYHKTLDNISNAISPRNKRKSKSRKSKARKSKSRKSRKSRK